jgi:hypothetical protein
MHSTVSSANPAINAVISIEHPLHAAVLRNDDRAAEVLASSGIMSANQLPERLRRPLFSARPDLIGADVKMCIGCPAAWPDVLGQQPVEDI